MNREEHISLHAKGNRPVGACIFLFATAWLVIGIAAFIGCGCEDEGDTTIVYEGDDIVMSTNSPGIVIKDNDGSVTVTQTTSEDGYTPTVVVSGNTGKVYVATQPQQPPQPEGSTDE